MRENLLELHSCSEPGYHPLVWYEGWRVAYLNDTPKFHLENIRDMQRHTTSDEVFVLLKGSCTLYIGDGNDAAHGKIEAVPLKPGVMYNVKKGVWHTHALADGASVIVIENADVSSENTDHIAIDPAELS
ncbi:MAG: cupin domain-containing protein [Lachnospiraceae bacterium]|nr:cupin domain-containing protein [Lachnospiraceae bacterium]